MVGRIVAVVDDLFFLAKIQQTSQQLDVTVEAVQPGSLQSSLSAGGVCAVFLDLNHRSGAAIGALKAVKQHPLTSTVPVVGFLSHVQGELAHAARAAGCNRVLARSAFSQQLPLLLKEFSLGAASKLPNP